MDGLIFDRTLFLPSVDALVSIALTETDFLGDLIDGDLGWLEHIAANSVDAAADIWADAHANVPVPLPLILAARRALIEQAQDLLADMAEAEADRRRDAQEAGDLNADGDPIPHPRYRSI